MLGEEGRRSSGGRGGRRFELKRAARGNKDGTGREKGARGKFTYANESERRRRRTRHCVVRSKGVMEILLNRESG